MKSRNSKQQNNQNSNNRANKKADKNQKPVNPKNLRKNFLIDRTLQYGAIAQVLSLMMLIIVIFTVGSYFFFWLVYESGNYNYKENIIVYQQIEVTKTVFIDNIPQEQRYFESVAQEPVSRFELLLPSLLINNILVMIVLTFLGIGFTHRFAGPAYRIQKDLHTFRTEDSSKRIHLRQKDALQGLAKSINELLEETAQLQGDKNAKKDDTLDSGNAAIDDSDNM